MLNTYHQMSQPFMEKNVEMVPKIILKQAVIYQLKTFQYLINIAIIMNNLQMQRMLYFKPML